MIYEDFEGLEYMKMVIKEIWRLYVSSLILILREVMLRFKVKGYDIYFGMWIYVNIWVIGCSFDVWKEFDEFIFERFVDSNVEIKGMSYELLLFGSGWRGCLVMYMGLSMVEFILVNLLYYFDWKVMEEVSVEEVFGFISYRKYFF